VTTKIQLDAWRTFVICRLADIRESRKELEKQEQHFQDQLVDVNNQIADLKLAENDTL
jgi:hypothetical protein